MNFTIKSSKEKETIGITQKGNTIQYKMIPEDKLIFWKPNPDLANIPPFGKANFHEIELLAKDNETYRIASRIKIECNFYVEMSMVDLLECSKILSVDYRYSTAMSSCTIAIIPHPLFNYEKLNDILFDMVKKYNL
ncbi:hypothetical protein D0T84_14060 [Dysgonomonas sp. 521]|uniref:hypothetical protein n=1 Tax=Dysgonomonas sp. 521 TaxID=2302932 RepID=UPI0013D12B7E|nr:hypothetical protein [Dysgonomonas sp. 521]NDV96029.1 hypothetical protein [Dysgonomonas sp. 521]